MTDLGAPPTIISSPPLDLICSPPEQERDEGPSAPTDDEPQVSPDQIRVYFVIIFSGYTNETFDEAKQSKLVDTLRNATIGLGATSNLTISIRSIEDIGISKKRRRRNLLSIMPLSTGVKVQGEANFAQQDENVAVEMMQILTDAPSTIFPMEEFGEVNVPQIEIVQDKTTTIILPIVLGVLGGLVLCILVAFLFVKNNKNGYKRDMSDQGHSTFHPFSDKECEQRSESMVRHQASLLQSISSRDYSSSAHIDEKPGVVINNIGAGFL